MGERKGPALLSCGVAKLQAGGGDGGWERCGHVRFRDQVPVACTVGGTCISWTQKVETGVHSPPAPSRIGQQLAHLALLIGSWTAMAECTDVETIRARPANTQCEQRYRDAQLSVLWARSALRRDLLCFRVIVFFFTPCCLFLVFSASLTFLFFPFFFLSFLLF